MKKIILLMIFFVGIVYSSNSQSHKNIENYNTENTKIATFTIDTTRYLSEEVIVLTRVLYSYPDIYFADVKNDGTGIVFLSKSSSFEKFFDELYNKKGYILTNIEEKDYDEMLFFNTYYNSNFKSPDYMEDKVRKVILGIEDKDNLNFEIAKNIHNN